MRAEALGKPDTKLTWADHTSYDEYHLGQFIYL
jgi:hypothetical protein